MSGLTSAGFEKKTLGELIEETNNRILALITPYANVLPNAVFGQISQITSEGYSELWELGEILFNSTSILGSGVSLDLNAALLGITRKTATHAYIIDYKVKTSGATTIPVGFQVTDGTNVFETQEETVISSSGYHSITVYSASTGELSVNTGAVDEIVGTVPANVSGVENASSSTFVNGSDIESDTELRTRIQTYPFVTRNKATEGVRNAVLSLNTELARLNFNTVLGCYVVENDSDAYVAGRAPHSIECVVYYPADANTNQKVLEAVAWSKAEGIQTVTTTSSSFSDTVSLDGKTNITVVVSKANEVPIYINVDTSPNLTADEKTNLTNWIVDWFNDMNLGTDVIVFGKNSLSDRLNSFTGAELTDYTIKIGTASSPTLDDNITIAFSEVATIDAAHINIGNL